MYGLVGMCVGARLIQIIIDLFIGCQINMGHFDLWGQATRTTHPWVDNGQQRNQYKNIGYIKQLFYYEITNYRVGRTLPAS